jgi:acyl-CoA thioesterase FadM
MEYRITSAAKGNDPVATGTVSGVVFDYNSDSSTPMPDSLRARIMQLEATGSG